MDVVPTADENMDAVPSAGEALSDIASAGYQDKRAEHISSAGINDVEAVQNKSVGTGVSAKEVVPTETVVRWVEKSRSR